MVFKCATNLVASSHQIYFPCSSFVVLYVYSSNKSSLAYFALALTINWKWWSENILRINIGCGGIFCIYHHFVRWTFQRFWIIWDRCFKILIGSSNISQIKLIQKYPNHYYYYLSKFIFHLFFALVPFTRCYLNILRTLNA